MSLEKDVTQIRKLVEQGDLIFKPATPDNLYNRKSAEEKKRAEREAKRLKSMNDPKKIEARSSYADFKRMLKVAKTGDIAKILTMTYELLDHAYAYKSARNSEYARSSLKHLLRQEGLLQGDELPRIPGNAYYNPASYKHEIYTGE